MSTNPSATTLFCSNCGASVNPGDAFCSKCASPQPNYVAQAPVVGRVQYAGFWIRFVAILLDGIILSIVLSPFSFAIFGAMGVSARIAQNSDDPERAMALLFPAIMFIVAISIVGKWLYEALLTSSSKQATIGKMACGLRVTDLQGQRLTFARASGRFFAKYVSGLTLCIGYIIAGFTERKQALHDFIAGTYVLKG
jgi:uncharacterized RDD family membrane protein YckC